MTTALLLPTAAAGVTEATGAFGAAWLLVALPMLGAAVLLLGGARTDRWGHWFGVLASASAFVVAAVVWIAMLGLPADERVVDLHLFSWIPAGAFSLDAGMRIDPLSMSFVLLVTFVGTLIHVYSVAYMEHDTSRRRFFAYLNLFVAAMLLLVLADSYVLLFVGWEGVGLASYLLIGFWNHETPNAVAAKKAFVANRVGDLGLIIAIALIFATFGATDFVTVFGAAGGAGEGVLTAIGLLLLLGATGKSAQFPLQSWLGDAMAGPTPVSALIHAATMVTAGVYLVVRSGPVFDGAPTALLVVAIVGAITLLFGAIVASAKDDIKKSLAGSTMSQIGYMMLGAGLGPIGYAFAIFHLLTHGFFKAGHVPGRRLGDARHGRHGRHAPVRRPGDLHEDHLGDVRVRLARDHGRPAVLRLLEQGQDHRVLVRDERRRGLAAVGVRHGRADRRRDHRVLHVADVLHDLPRQGAMVGRSRRWRARPGRTGAPPARVPGADDLADDHPRGRLGGARRGARRAGQHVHHLARAGDRARSSTTSRCSRCR